MQVVAANLACAMCGSTLSGSFKVPSRQMAEVTCPVCGTYRITYEARRAIEADPDFARRASYVMR